MKSFFNKHSAGLMLWLTLMVNAPLIGMSAEHPNIAEAIPPVAQFTVNAQVSCDGWFVFTDQSLNQPTSWLWYFGDGGTSYGPNPTHQYFAQGTYYVTLVVSNAFGSDTAYISVTYDQAPTPTLMGDMSICQGESTTLSVPPLLGYNPIWTDAQNLIVLGTGLSFSTPILFDTSNYFVKYVQNMPIDTVGSSDIQVNGGNYANNSVRTLLFTATTPFTLISAMVNASGAGNRTFILYNAGGAVIQSVVRYVPAGISRVQLNFNINAAGNYSVGGANMNLWRNNNGVTYPYALPGVVSIYSSNSGTSTYYFLYDWEVSGIGCSSPTAPVAVNVLPTPTAAFGASSYANTVSLTDQSVGANSWYWDFGDGSTSTDQNPLHTYGAPGTYTVTQVASNGSCHDTLAQAVNVVYALVPPIAQMTVGAQLQCAGLFEFVDQSQNLPIDWLWDFGDGQTSTLENPQHQYATAGTFTVTLVVSNLFGTDTTSLQVVSTAPSAPVVMGDLLVCPGGSTILSITELPGYQPVWFDSTGTLVAINDSLVTPPLYASANYSVRFEELMPTQSVGSSNLQANGSHYNNGVNRTLLFTAQQPFYLASARVNASFAGNRTFHLYDAGGNVLQSETVYIPAGISRISLHFNISAPGNYSIGGSNMGLWRNDAAVAFPYALPGVVSIYSTNIGNALYYFLYDWEINVVGCYSAMVPAPVMVQPTVGADFTWSTNEETATFVDQTANASSWHWDFGDGQTSSLQNPTHAYATPGNYNVTLVATGGPCNDTLVQVVSVVFATQAPVAQAAVDIDTNCSGLFSFTDQSLNNPYSWFWDFGDGTTDTVQNPVHLYTVPGTYTVDLVVTNPFGSSAASIQINYIAPDGPVPTGDTDICAGTSTTLSVAVNPGYTPVWLDSTGTYLLSTNATFVTPNLEAPTTFQVQYREQLPVTNVGSVNLQINGGYMNDPAVRVLYFEAYMPFVLQSVSVNALVAGNRDFVLYDENGNPIRSIKAFVPAGVSRVPLYMDVPEAGFYGIGGANMELWANTGAVNYPYVANGMVSIYGNNAPANPSTTYYFLYDWEVSPLGCNSPKVPITVEASGPTANFTWNNVHSSYTFTDQSTGATSWQWSFGNGNVSTDQNPTCEYITPGVYNVTLITFNGTCYDTLTQVVDVVFATQIPVADFTANALESCSGHFFFSDFSVGMPYSWYWDFGDASTSTDQNPDHQYAIPGIYTVTLTATNPVGTDSYTLSVIYSAPSAPAVSGKTNLCEGDSTTLVAATDPGATTHWMDANGVEIAVGDVLATPNLFANTTYQVSQTRDAIQGYVGSQDLNANGGYLNVAVPRTLLFSAYVGLTIVSADVNAAVGGNRTFSLYDATGTNILQSVTVMVPPGYSRVNLGLVVPEAGQYQVGGENLNLWRNFNGVFPYPYSLPSVLDITGTNFVANPQGFYYFLYNWEVISEECPGVSAIVPVNVSPSPVANFTCNAVNEVVTFTDLSQSGSAWVWDFGDGSTDTVQNPVHSYAAVGNYNVQLTVTNGSCSETVSHPCDVLFIGVEQPADRDFRLFPNPAKDQVRVQLGGSLRGAETVEVFSADGRMVYGAAWPSLGGNTMTIDCTDMAEGTYLIRVNSDDAVVVKRFVVQR